MDIKISEIKIWTSKFQKNNLTLHLKELEKEQTKRKGQLRNKIHTIQKMNETKS